MAATLAIIEGAGTPASQRLQTISWPLPVTNVLLRAKTIQGSIPVCAIIIPHGAAIAT